MLNKNCLEKLPTNIDLDDLQDMTDIFEYIEIAKKSKATQNDVDSLVKTIKKKTLVENQIRNI